jgi:hypothetical protein
MDRKRNSEKQEPPEQPIEPEMEDKPAGDDQSRRKPATEPPKEKRSDDL